MDGLWELLVPVHVTPKVCVRIHMLVVVVGARHLDGLLEQLDGGWVLWVGADFHQVSQVSNGHGVPVCEWSTLQPQVREYHGWDQVKV